MRRLQTHHIQIMTACRHITHTLSYCCSLGQQTELSVSLASLITVAPSDKQTELSVSPASLSYCCTLGQSLMKYPRNIVFTFLKHKPIKRCELWILQFFSKPKDVWVTPLCSWYSTALASLRSRGGLTDRLIISRARSVCVSHHTGVNTVLHRL